MSESKIIRHINLQLFAEGSGDGGTGADGTSGVNAGASLPAAKGDKNPLANVKYGIQDGDTQTATVSNGAEDLEAEFDALRKGKYKAQYDARVSKTVQERLKATKEKVDRYDALTPTIEMLERKYGVQSGDVEGLNKAIEEDDSYYEEEALEKGVSVEQLKSLKKMERENANLKRMMEERDKTELRNRLYNRWFTEAEAVKKIYPTFSIEEELKNPEFTKLISNNVSVQTAFEVLHKNEILPAAMQYTAQQVERKLTNKIMANGQRPMENGLNSQSASVVKSDVSQLSKADREEIIRRVARGEKIRF